MLPRYACVSADETMVQVRDAEGGHVWRFALVEEDGWRDIAADDVEEASDGARPGPFHAVAGAFLFALREARSRGLIDG